MKINRILATGLAGSLIASCCSYDSSQPISTTPVAHQTVELVGFQPNDVQRTKLLAILSHYDKQVYRIQEYSDGKPVGDPIGTLQDIGCELEGKIDFWVKHATGGKSATVAASSYAGVVGLSCSTSCPPGGGHLYMQSYQAADAVAHLVLGYPSPSTRHHHK
jgi:hypothetical protein